MDPDVIAALRIEYVRTGIDEAVAGVDPLPLLAQWLADAHAAGLPEPNAVAVATSTPDGIPSVRFVLMKGLDERGLSFFTNYDSRKGAELSANPHAALVFPWFPLQRQVRVEGLVERLGQDENDAYFASRPHGSQLGAVASPQSQVVPDRAYLDDRYADLESRFPDAVPRPEHWGGFRVRPTVVEFWQGRSSRLHDRIRFTRAGTGWVRDRLAP